ncbi:MAG: TonB-dependent receptor [Gammaproteobacteria bacterium]|nr:TonB-dependent receptor [Gammaproteobacteria bacterium]
MICSKNRSVLFIALTGSLLMSDASAAPQATQQASSGELQEIIITGQRREETLLQAAVAVVAFTEETLRDANVTRPGDFISMSPNVTFVQSSSPGELFVTIRGNTQVREGDTSTALVIDGVQQLGQNTINQELYALQSIEVLKGPQGALYGRNALGGAIVIRTRDPNFELLEGEIKAGVGNGGGMTGSATVSGPFSETLAFRAGVSSRRTDGFYENIYTNEDPHRFNETTVSARLLWKPSDALKIDLKARWQEMTGGALAWNAQLTEAFTPPGGFLANVYNLFPNAKVVSGDDTSIPYEANIPGFADNYRLGFSLKIDYESAIGNLVSITSVERSRDFFGGDSFPYRFRGGFPVGANALAPGGETQSTYREDKFLQQEIRFSSPQDAQIRYVVGAQYVDYDPLIETMSALDSNGVNLLRAPNPRGSLNQTTGWTAGEQTNTAYAFFANFSYDLSDQLELDISGRYDKDEKEQQNFVGCNAAAPGEVIVSGAVFCDSTLRRNIPTPTFVRRPGAKRDATFDRFQPKIALRYDISDEMSSYISYAVGFKTGGFNPFGTRALLQVFNKDTTVQDIFDQEEAKTYEIGLKSEFLDRRARFGVAAFFSDTSNAQLLEFRPEATLLAISTADEIDMKGIEADITAAVTSALTLQVAAGFTDTEIKKFSGQPTVVGGSRPQVPKVTGSAAGTYRWSIGEKMSGVVRLDYNYTGKTYWDWANTPGSARSSFGLLNARLAIESDSWSVAAWSRNLTDKAYNAEVIPILPGLVDALWRAPPRSFGVEFGYNW